MECGRREAKTEDALVAGVEVGLGDGTSAASAGKEQAENSGGSRARTLSPHCTVCTKNRPETGSPGARAHRIYTPIALAPRRAYRIAKAVGTTAGT